MRHLGLRREIVATARRMNALGLNQGTAGNVSARIPGGFLITPTGVPYEDCRPEDIVEMDGAGGHRGARLPSSEWRFHRDILAARPEVGAVVHVHSTFATTLACLGRGVPPFHYMITAAGGGDVRCAPYATFGSQELSDRVVAALAGRRACLLANHGMVAVGEDLRKALALAVEVEKLAEMYWRVLQAGTPVLLDDAEIVVVLEKFRSYGQPAGRRRRRPPATSAAASPGGGGRKRGSAATPASRSPGGRRRARRS